jgi:hypothetical protein
LDLFAKIATRKHWATKDERFEALLGCFNVMRNYFIMNYFGISLKN